MICNMDHEQFTITGVVSRRRFNPKLHRHRQSPECILHSTAQAEQRACIGNPDVHHQTVGISQLEYSQLAG